MSFSSSFEKKFNDDMHNDSQPGRAPAEVQDADMALKMKGRASPQLDIDIDMQEFRDKKDHPPRFSTLFDVKPSGPPPPPPRTPREFVREHYPELKRKSGIYMPMYLFILFVAIIFFESTIIFAYTIIGLYNNAPSRLFPWAGQGTAAISSADCAGWTQTQPAINIAPNFVLPQAFTEVVTVTVTITATPSISSSSPSSSSSTTLPSSATATAAAAAAASNIANLLGALGDTITSSSPSTTSLALVTVQPTRSTVTSVKMITKDAAGNVLSLGPTPTTTLTTFVAAPSETETGTSRSEGMSEGVAGETQEPIVIRPTTVSRG